MTIPGYISAPVHPATHLLMRRAALAADVGTREAYAMALADWLAKHARELGGTEVTIDLETGEATVS